MMIHDKLVSGQMVAAGWRGEENGGSPVPCMASYRQRCLLFAIGAFTVLAVDGCGGGDDSSSTSTTTTGIQPYTYVCKSSVQFSDLVDMGQKGIALDDDTFRNCPERIPLRWPNTEAKMQSVHLFTPWRKSFGDDRARRLAWSALVRHFTAYKLSVLVGQDVTCDPVEDDEQWVLTLDFMKLLRKSGVTIQGITIGNEMDLLQYRNPPPGCLDRLWEQRQFKSTFMQRVGELDAHGLGDVPITSIFSGAIGIGEEFPDIPEARVNDFVMDAYHRFGSRWVWSVTSYGIWDTSLLPESCDWKIGSAKKRCLKECQDITDLATNHSRYTSYTLAHIRQKIRNAIGTDDFTYWLGETGWSYPKPTALEGKSYCENFTSMQAFKTNYASFLAWNLSRIEVAPEKGGGWERGPDHVYYFTARDSNQFGVAEHFGLVGSCKDSRCKIDGQTTELFAKTAGVLSNGTADESNGRMSHASRAFVL